VCVCKGEVLVVSPPVTHYDEGVYTNPTQFDPDRFLKPRFEDKQKYSFISFGGGRHSKFLCSLHCVTSHHNVCCCCFIVVVDIKGTHNNIEREREREREKEKRASE